MILLKEWWPGIRAITTIVVLLYGCMLWLSVVVKNVVAEIRAWRQVHWWRVTTYVNAFETVENRRMKAGIEGAWVEDAARGHGVEGGGRKSRHSPKPIFHRTPNIHVVISRRHLKNVQQSGSIDIKVLRLNRGRKCRRGAILVLDPLSLCLGLGRIRDATGSISVLRRDFSRRTSLELCSNPVKRTLFSSSEAV